MRALNKSIIYDNPLPQLKSRQSIFPWLCELQDGTILASHCIGEAFESVDAATNLSISHDGGNTFELAGPLFTNELKLSNHSESCKVTQLPDGRLCALGYAYDRSDPALPIGNPKTGGLLDDVIIISYSNDCGRSWSRWQTINSAWGPHVEASAPLYNLKSGAWVTPITGFAKWDGTHTGRNCGRLLRSNDCGKTWGDGTISMAFDNDEVTCFEQRLSELNSGMIVTIGWNENMLTGERLCNHYTLSTDGGRTFSKPQSTGIQGQASSICAIGGERLLALHSLRRDTERPGIYAYIVDLSRGVWDIQDELLLWEPATPIVKDASMAEIFSYLKFGQPGAILLKDGDALCCHWAEVNGQYKTFATRLSLN